MSGRDRGVTAIEFAIVLPVLLIIIYGIINLGVLMYNQAVITNAAREGARWASIHSSTTVGTTCTNSYSTSPVDACQAAFSYSTNLLINFGAIGTLQLTAHKDPPPVDFNTGTLQTVTVTYQYTGIGWYFSSIPSSYIAISGMLHE